MSTQQIQTPAIEASDTEVLDRGDLPALRFDISAYGGWGWSKVFFEGPRADQMATDYLARKGHLVIEPDWEGTDWDSFPLTWAALNPVCEHGLSLRLCAGPGHYPHDM